MLTSTRLVEPPSEARQASERPSSHTDTHTYLPRDTDSVMSLIRLLDPCAPYTRRPLIHTDGHTLMQTDIQAYRHMGGNTGRYQGSQADSAGKTSITRRGPVWKTCKAPRGKTNRTSQTHTHTHTHTERERERERETNRPKATNTQTDTHSQTDRPAVSHLFSLYHLVCERAHGCICMYVCVCVCMYIKVTRTYLTHKYHTHTYIHTMRTHTHTRNTFIHSDRHTRGVLLSSQSVDKGDTKGWPTQWLAGWQAGRLGEAPFGNPPIHTHIHSDTGTQSDQESSVSNHTHTHTHTQTIHTTHTPYHRREQYTHHTLTGWADRRERLSGREKRVAHGAVDRQPATAGRHGAWGALQRVRVDGRVQRWVDERHTTPGPHIHLPVYPADRLAALLRNELRYGQAENRRTYLAADRPQKGRQADRQLVEYVGR